MLRFFHTSDWHLGQFFYNHSRHYEHTCFLQWLLDELRQKQPDALLIAGDVFDVVNPSTIALKQLNQFIAQAHQQAPHLQILIIAGNHDSGYRLEQSAPLLEKYNTHVVGVIEWNEDKSLNTDKLIIPIYNKSKEITAWCIALPYLRPAEITAGQFGTTHTNDSLANNAGHAGGIPDSQAATEALYKHLMQEVRLRKTAEQSLILMTHAHMQGGNTSDSERPIVIGNAEALSTKLFDKDIQYVALGHLHRPQQIESAHIRYSGSPIPLSFSELSYQHQIVDVKLSVASQAEIQAIPVPRRVPLIRLKGDLEQVLAKAKSLIASDSLPIDQRTFLDVEYTSNTPAPPDFRQQLEQAIPGDNYRLVKISRIRVPSSTENSSTLTPAIELPTPKDLFQQVWQKKGFTPDDAVLNDFASLEDQAKHVSDNLPHIAAISISAVNRPKD